MYALISRYNHILTAKSRATDTTAAEILNSRTESNVTARSVLVFILTREVKTTTTTTTA